MSADVATPNAAYHEMAEDRELIHDLLGGTRIMRRRAEKWLPREPGESREAYGIRLNRSVLFNGLQRTVQTLTGKPMRRPASLADAPDPAIAALAGNVDLGGRNLTVFARDVLQAALIDGVTHILVDHPRIADSAGPGSGGTGNQGAGQGTGSGEGGRDGVRPYLVHVTARDLIGWRGQENGIGSRLTRIRIRETVNFCSGTWEDRVQRQIRVLYPGRFEIWRRRDDSTGSAAGEGDWQRAESGESSLGCIPLVTIYANRTGFMTARPPLMDLAWLNLAHWQSASDQRHILHVARVPILFGRNLTLPEDGLELGPNRIVTGDGDGADLRYVEHGGAAIAAGRQDLIDLEDRMAVMGLDLMTRRAGSGGTTATARAIDAAENSTALLALVRAVEDGLTEAFGYMADWLDIPRAAAGRVLLHPGEVPDIDDPEIPSAVRANVEKNRNPGYRGRERE